MTENQNTTAAGSVKAEGIHTTTRKCNCGCGENTSSSKTAYKPGHDARHVGMIARHIVAENLHGAAAEVELAKLPSEKLQHKAGAMVVRIAEKAKALQAKKDTKPAPKKASAAADRKAAAQTPGSKRAGAFIDGMQEAVNEKLAEVVAREEAEHAAALAAEVALRRADIEAQDAAEVQTPEWDDEFQGPTKWVVAQGVKIGRWVYPARQWEDGLIVRNTKRDGSGEWVPAPTR